MAKCVAQSRSAVNNMYSMNANLKGLEMQLTTMNTSKTALDALKNSTEIMGKVNASMNPAEINQIMKEHAKATMIMEVNQEGMDTAMEGFGEDTGEADDVYN